MGERGRRQAAAVGLTEARRALASMMSERDLQRQVVDLAELRGFMTYHTFDSRRSAAGFPDLVLVRAPRVVFAELKSERGAMRDDQFRWLEALGNCNTVESHLWRPTDLAEIEEVLR